MSENNIEKLFVESCIVSKIPTYLDIVKDSNMPKEDWEKNKQSILKEVEEADKYYEEKEKGEKKPILTDEEREYLRSVIKPFRNDVRYISKAGFGEEYIHIKLDGDIVLLPYFEKGTMYKGMKARKEYSLEELGL